MRFGKERISYGETLRDLSYPEFLGRENKRSVYGDRVRQRAWGGVWKMPEGDFIADDQAQLYYVSVDVDGEIGWESGTFHNKGREPAHVIEVLTVSTPAAYKSYLRKRGVSYIIAGEKELNCKTAMEKLYELFHIKKVLICGGGIVNYSFLQEGMIDELSLFLAPVTDGSSGAASLFSLFPSLAKGKPIEFVLKEMEKIGEGGLHLTYLVRNA